MLTNLAVVCVITPAKMHGLRITRIFVFPHFTHCKFAFNIPPAWQRAWFYAKLSDVTAPHRDWLGAQVHLQWLGASYRQKKTRNFWGAYTGWPKKVIRYQVSSLNRIKNCN